MSKIKNITFAQLQTLYEVSRKINSELNLQKLLDEIMGPDVPEFQSVVLQLHAPLMGALRTRPRGEADLERGAGGARMFLVAGFTEDRDRKEKLNLHDWLMIETPHCKIS